MKRLTRLVILLEMIALMESSGWAASLPPGDSKRTVLSGGLVRTYLVHVPPGYVHGRPTPVVIALHPLFNDGPAMAELTDLSAKADREGFLVVYPNGTDIMGILHWNSGCIFGDTVDDVGFIARLLDDLATVASVDPRRVFATGYSDGAPMSFRLASELSNRIAAIAAVGGNMGVYTTIKATRPVPILQIRGTEDNNVNYWGLGPLSPWHSCRSVPDTLFSWVAHNRCSNFPREVVALPDKAVDGTWVWRWTYGPGLQGSEYVYYEISGGGHTWPGSPLWLLMEMVAMGRTSQDISANDVIWEFFLRHPIP